MRTIGALLLALLSVLPTAAHGDDPAKPIESQLTVATKKQKYNSCHVNAALDLYEAACNRATGEKVKLSEAYYFAAHIAGRLEETAGLKGIAPALPFSKPDNKLLGIQVENGHDVDTIRRIQQNPVCLDDPKEEEALYAELEDSAKRTFDKLPDDQRKQFAWGGLGWLLAGVGVRIDENIHRAPRNAKCQYEYTLLQKLGIRFGGFAAASTFLGGSYIGNASARKLGDDAKKIAAKYAAKKPKPTAACFQKQFATVKKAAPSFDEMKILLDAKIPFLCSGNFEYAPKDSNEAHVVRRDGPEENWHVAIALGYQEKDGAKSLKIRDHFGGVPHEYTLPDGTCKYITILYGPDEKHLVE